MPEGPESFWVDQCYVATRTEHTLEFWCIHLHVSLMHAISMQSKCCVIINICMVVACPVHWLKKINPQDDLHSYAYRQLSQLVLCRSCQTC